MTLIIIICTIGLALNLWFLLSGIKRRDSVDTSIATAGILGALTGLLW